MADANSPTTSLDTFIQTERAAGRSWIANFRHQKKLQEGGEGEISIRIHPVHRFAVVAKTLLNCAREVRKKQETHIRQEQEVINEKSELIQTIYLGYCDAGDLWMLKTEFASQSQSFPEALVWSVTTQLDAALAFIHTGYSTPAYNNGRWIPIIHRDLKPENVMLSHIPGSPYPHVRLIDFGLSTFVSNSDFIFKTDLSFGTAEYQPPERPEARPEGDMWANGAIIHFLCLKEPPLDAMGADVDDEGGSSSNVSDGEWVRSLEHRPIPINVPPRQRQMQWASGNATEDWEETYSDLLNFWMMEKLTLDWRGRLGAVDAVETMGHRFRAYAFGRSVEEFAVYVKSIPVVIDVLPPMPVGMEEDEDIDLDMPSDAEMEGGQ